MIPIIVVIFSFYLEIILSNFIPISSNLFIPLCTLVSILIIYPFFYHDFSSYIKICIIMGILYDIVFTNTLGLHAVIFLMIGFIVYRLNIHISNNVLNVAMMTVILVVSYRLLSYLLLLLVGYKTFEIDILFNSITSSLILNMLYASLLYFICDRWSIKKHVTKID